MALSPAILNLQNRDALQTILHGRTGNTPLTLPFGARGTPPANAVPNAAAAAGTDALELSGGAAPTVNGNLAIDGSGLYRLVQASSFNLSASSMTFQLGSGGGSAAGRGALSALTDAMGIDGTGGGNAMERLRASLEALGIDDKGIRDLMMVARMLQKLDPDAFDKFVDSMEGFAKQVTDAQAPAAPAAGAAAQAQSAAQAGSFQGFSLNYVSVSISMTEVTAQTVTNADGTVSQVTARSFELRFERLEISIGQAQGQEQPKGDPVVLDLDDDGAEMRPTSDGVKFDIEGSGRPVQIAWTGADDALLFYDANLNGLLDDGRELVGNRIPGLDGMADLSAMDADGDGQVTSADPAWQFLRLFRDANGDGRSGAGEVGTLDQLGIAALSALWDRAQSEEGEGLLRAGSSTFTRADGTRGLMLDYYLGYRPVETDGRTA